MLSSLAKRLRLFLRSELDLLKDRISRESSAWPEAGAGVRFQAGLQHAKWLEGRRFDPIHLAAHRVYSQFGEDGVIQYLLQHVPIENDLFIEFGVQDYRESNTRFLLEKDDWRGVIVDPSEDAEQFLIESHLKWRHTIDFIKGFVTTDNVNEIFRPYAGDIGLLSIDVDGVDYFLWEALEVVSPRIVVVEYQSNFGPDLPISTPYAPDFDRTRYHYSNLAAGASISALAHLANRKGYALVGRSDQHNAFFVRRDVLGDLREVAPAEAYRETRFRESLDRQGGRTYLTTMEERRREIRDVEVVDVTNGRRMTIGEAFGLR
jgi:hypothetical protein